MDADPSDWADITRSLIASHPIDGPTLVTVVLNSWRSIFESRLGSGFHIGREIRPAPQIMGFLLHALIPLELSRDRIGWRADLISKEKDLVCEANDAMSIEIKTSSHRSQIFGNRSFGVENAAPGKKAKDGFYLAVNFESWSDAAGRLPEIRLVRFGWLDHSDWVAQRSQTGQQASLPAQIENLQLLTLYHR